IQDMRAGTSTPTIITDPGIHQGEWTQAYAGNPELKPWRAAAIDLSVEKYFGKRSYVAAAAFRKNLLSYITYGVSARDNTFLPRPTNLPPGLVVQQFGPVFQPLNGTGGKVEGIELAGALEASMFVKALDGFGAVASFSKLSSSIRDQRIDQNSGQVIAGSSTSLNGLSGRSNSVTFYYEKDGIAARVSQRYRSPFTATTKDIYLNATTRTQAADKVLDMQLGYSFETGPYKGLSILLQVNNLLDKTVMNMKSVGSDVSVPAPKAQYPHYITHFGRQTLLGMNY
ncbi:MAG: TonB-dependent receptor, partial [Burkholderiales bacterium PBB5]